MSAPRFDRSLPLPASRPEAVKLGLPRYQGQPCALGHTERYTINSTCVACHAARRRQGVRVYQQARDLRKQVLAQASDK